MIFAFGCAWPPAIYKSWTARTTKGKSLAFLIIVLLGYMSGIIHKILYSWDAVFWFYLADFLMVFADLCLYFRNAAIDRRAKLQMESLMKTESLTPAQESFTNKGLVMTDRLA